MWIKRAIGKNIYRARVIEEIDRGAIDTSCHPVQIAIMRCDWLGIFDTQRIVTAQVTGHQVGSVPGRVLPYDVN